MKIDGVILGMMSSKQSSADFFKKLSSKPNPFTSQGGKGFQFKTTGTIPNPFVKKTGEQKPCTPPLTQQQPWTPPPTQQQPWTPPPTQQQPWTPPTQHQPQVQQQPWTPPTQQQPWTPPPTQQQQNSGQWSFQKSVNPWPSTQNTSFSINEEADRVVITGGMGSENCFAKCISYKKKKFYQKTDHSLKNISRTTIVDTLRYIVSFYGKETHSKVIYSPGYLSIPYLFELADMAYLPSELFMKFESIDSVRESIKYANEQGNNCYGIIRFNSVLNEWHVCVKFRSLPVIYREFLNDSHCRNFYVMSLWTPEGVLGGTNNHQIGGESIVYLCMGEENALETFSKYFGQHLSDMVEKKPCYMIANWCSTIDYITEVSEDIGECRKVHMVTTGRIESMFTLGYESSLLFMRKNNIDRRGTVLLPDDMMGHPLHESYIGHAPCFYFPENNQSVDRNKVDGNILAVVDKEPELFVQSMANYILLQKDIVSSFKEETRGLQATEFKYLNVFDINYILGIHAFNVVVI